MADVVTLLVALSSAPLTIGAIHLARWLVPLVLPGLVARPAQGQTPAQQTATSADVERRLTALEMAMAHDRDRAVDRDRELMGLLGDIRADVGRARRRNEGG